MILNWPFCLPSFTVKENIKWQRGKSNPLETYVDDQTATLTMLSNAAFVVGSEYIHTHKLSPKKSSARLRDPASWLALVAEGGGEFTQPSISLFEKLHKRGKIEFSTQSKLDSRSGEHPAPRRCADLPVRPPPPGGHAGGEAAPVPVLPAQEVPLPVVAQQRWQALQGRGQGQEGEEAANIGAEAERGTHLPQQRQGPRHHPLHSGTTFISSFSTRLIFWHCRNL